jgi:hypothetical protein
MIAIIGITAVLILALFLILFRLRPNRGASRPQQPHPSSGPLHPGGPRSSGIN